ncbi:MAG: DEAD/DEAH box helicase family protein [Gemmatimonadales bacterium]|nr:DEAD/DEAH box helicase family protein [Gemmatimonadales bacterium]
MTDTFFSAPILNSPYEYPRHFWELDDAGQPTGVRKEGRRPASFVTPVPQPKKQGKGQAALQFDSLSSAAQAYDPRPIINELRIQVDRWRELKDPGHWHVTPETARLLQHWRSHQFAGIRPFFCQVEAVETAIWLTEVAPKLGKDGQRFINHLKAVNGEAVGQDDDRFLSRLALKLATGAGKTTVMAMLIAWQTINAVRRPGSKHFTRGFLIVTPGITIRDRLRLLKPNDPDAYYGSRELVPSDLVAELGKAKIVITNYHAFKLRETMPLAKGTRGLLEGHGPRISTLETDGQMLQRVCPELMAMKNILAINDEAHHCYREKPIDPEEEALKGDEKKEAEQNKEAARLWISGLETVNRKLGIQQVVDLSATPFFLSGSGYAEGTLFPWTMSDFSLMDAIECGIVKLPRVPVADNIPEAEAPIYRDLWKHIGKQMPKKGRGKGDFLDPHKLPVPLQTAIEALYGHYAKTFELWQEKQIEVPPCFIVVCNNTATSKLVYDFISGFERTGADGSTTQVPGRLELFQNHDSHGNPLARPRTLLIDSEQLESGEALDDNFRKMAAAEIDTFRREIIERTGNRADAEGLTDQDLLREVMNTVGKPGKLGEQIRCVVSVSMLTEGWDANTVTHVLGIRAFGTQLLCEQVIGRALRRQSYDLNEAGLYNVEYADVFGVPFDFTAKPVVAPPQPPKPTVQVKAMPDRAALEIRFPRVAGYRVELPEERLEATFTDDSTLVLTPELVGPTITQNSGIIGEVEDLSLERMKDKRQSTILFRLAQHLMMTKWRDANGEPKLYLFGQLKAIAREWMEHHLVCKGGTYPAQLSYLALADLACERITAAIMENYSEERPVVPLLDPYNPEGTTRIVNFTTSKLLRWKTSPEKCHINWVICDSNWEAEFCRAVEGHPRVHSYVKNHSLGFEVPYRMGSSARKYRPDFIVRVDDGRGADDLLNLVVEIKGRRGEDAKEKASTLRHYWVPSINRHGGYGRWAAAEFTDVYAIEADFAATIDAHLAELIAAAIANSC